MGGTEMKDKTKKPSFLGFGGRGLYKSLYLKALNKTLRESKDNNGVIFVKID
jgi:hypothetical protein